MAGTRAKKGRNVIIDKKEHGPNSRNTEEETQATIRWKPKQRKDKNQVKK